MNGGGGGRADCASVDAGVSEHGEISEIIGKYPRGWGNIKERMRGWGNINKRMRGCGNNSTIITRDMSMVTFPHAGRVVLH